MPRTRLRPGHFISWSDRFAVPGVLLGGGVLAGGGSRFLAGLGGHLGVGLAARLVHSLEQGGIPLVRLPLSQELLRLGGGLGHEAAGHKEFRRVWMAAAADDENQHRGHKDPDAAPELPEQAESQTKERKA